MLKSINPYNNEPIGEFEQLEFDELDKILHRAQQGFFSWRETSFAERADFLMRLAENLKENSKEYATLISREMGKVLKESEKEVNKSAMALEYFAKHGEDFLKEEKTKAGEGTGMVVYQPMGVILAIMPWNYPFWQFFRFAATTLMAGNTIVLKHSSDVPACSKKIEEIFAKVCFPGGVFQSMVVSSSNINHIIKDFRVQGVSLTGGVEAGAEVAQQASKHIKKAVLELGGSDPFIVLEDADIQKAAKAGVKSRMKNFGQSCDAAKRFIIHESVADEFLEGFKKELENWKFGDPLNEDSDYGPLSSKKQRDILQKQVDKTLEMGATVYWKGNQAPEENAFFNPMIITDIPAGSPAYKDELFGPVASVFVVKDGMEAVRVANDTDYGLGAAIWSADKERARKMAYQVQSGIIYMNDEVHSRPELPFGGLKKSGLGHEMAVVGSREFTNRKSLWWE